MTGTDHVFLEVNSGPYARWVIRLDADMPAVDPSITLSTQGKTDTMKKRNATEPLVRLRTETNSQDMT